MAVEKFNFLDESGVQNLAKYILQAANQRDKDRILTAINAAAYSDADHVLSAAALLALIGNINNFDSTIDGTGNTVLDKIKAIKLAIGTEATAEANDGTVYGEIAQVRSEISALTHLTYQTVIGDIETEVPTAQAQTDVLYLQKDEDSYVVGLDGYLQDTNGDRATANDGTDDYYAYVKADGKIYKATASAVSDTELASNDAIFANVATQADTTWNLYIAQPIMGEGAQSETVVDINWICVGDTSLDLANYWDKSDRSTEQLKQRILQAISTSDIQNAVNTAFSQTALTGAGTDPYPAQA